MQLGFALAIVMAMAMGSWHTQRGAAAGGCRLEDHTHQVISPLREVMSTVTDAETGGRGFVITNAGQRTFDG